MGAGGAEADAVDGLLCNGGGIVWAGEVNAALVLARLGKEILKGVLLGGREDFEVSLDLFSILVFISVIRV